MGIIDGQRTNLVCPLVAVKADGVGVRLFGIHLGVLDPVPAEDRVGRGRGGGRAMEERSYSSSPG